MVVPFVALASMAATRCATTHIPASAAVKPHASGLDGLLPSTHSRQRKLAGQLPRPACKHTAPLHVPLHCKEVTHSLPTHSLTTEQLATDPPAISSSHPSQPNDRFRRCSAPPLTSLPPTTPHHLPRLLATTCYQDHSSGNQGIRLLRTAYT